MSKSIMQTITICNKSSAASGMDDRLATIDVGRKVGAAMPLSVGELTQCRLYRGLPPNKVAY